MFEWLTGKSAPTSAPSPEAQTPNSTGAKPKPCCVCIPEKEARDQCLLYAGEDTAKCNKTITEYRACMEGFGFKLPASSPQ